MNPQDEIRRIAGLPLNEALTKAQRKSRVRSVKSEEGFLDDMESDVEALEALIGEIEDHGNYDRRSRDDIKWEADRLIGSANDWYADEYISNIKADTAMDKTRKRRLLKRFNDLLKRWEAAKRTYNKSGVANEPDEGDYDDSDFDHRSGKDDGYGKYGYDPY